MSDQDEDEDLGELQLVWYSREHDLELWAQFDGFVYWLFGDEQKTIWLGEAEDLDELESWAFDLFVEVGLVPGRCGCGHCG